MEKPLKIYRGYRKMQLGLDGQPVTCKCVVTVEDGGSTTVPLDPRLDIRNHSPSGFEWGYGGSGPAQLALALVADCCGEAQAIPTVYQKFKAKVIARLPNDGWVLTEEDITGAIED